MEDWYSESEMSCGSYFPSEEEDGAGLADLSPVRRRPVIGYTLFDKASIPYIQAERIGEVQAVLQVPPDVARLLLMHWGWDPLAVCEAVTERGHLEAFIRAGVSSATAFPRDDERFPWSTGGGGHGGEDDTAGLLPAVGASPARPPPADVLGGPPSADGGGGAAAEGPGCPPPRATFLCAVCMNDVPAEQASAMRCGHGFCDECWAGHLRVAVEEGGGKPPRCMYLGCKSICDPAAVLRILGAVDRREAGLCGDQGRTDVLSEPPARTPGKGPGAELRGPGSRSSADDEPSCRPTPRVGATAGDTRPAASPLAGPATHATSATVVKDVAATLVPLSLDSRGFPDVHEALTHLYEAERALAVSVKRQSGEEPAEAARRAARAGGGDAAPACGTPGVARPCEAAVRLRARAGAEPGMRARAGSGRAGPSAAVFAASARAICPPTPPSPTATPRRPLSTRYLASLRDSFVTDAKWTRWCPSVPHCGAGAGADGPEGAFTEVACACGQAYCLSCGEAPHAPATCAMMADWLRLQREGDASSAWLDAHTKPCPRCKKPVEKTGGCNLVVCVCGQAFCWLCGSATGSSHTWETIKGHSCGAFREQAQERSDLATRQLRRYLHYQLRHDAHRSSLRASQRLASKLATGGTRAGRGRAGVEAAAAARARLASRSAHPAPTSSRSDLSLATPNPGPATGVSAPGGAPASAPTSVPVLPLMPLAPHDGSMPPWLTEVLRQLLLARRVLAYSYVFAFFAFGGEHFRGDGCDPESLQQTLFEDKQAVLEQEAERLQGTVEAAASPDEQELRAKAVDLAASLDARASKLFDVVQQDIAPRVMFPPLHIAPYPRVGGDAVRVTDRTTGRPDGPREGGTEGTDGDARDDGGPADGGRAERTGSSPPTPPPDAAAPAALSLASVSPRERAACLAPTAAAADGKAGRPRQPSTEEQPALAPVPPAPTPPLERPAPATAPPTALPSCSARTEARGRRAEATRGRIETVDLTCDGPDPGARAIDLTGEHPDEDPGVRRVRGRQARSPGGSTAGRVAG